MNNEPIEGMVVTADGRNAVMVDTKNGHYGWVFVKHPDGMWVSSRKASAAELSAAEHHYNSEAALRKIFGARRQADTSTATLASLAGADIERAISRGATAGLIMRDICEHEPDDTPESVCISVKALELILLERLKQFQATQPDLSRVMALLEESRHFANFLDGERGGSPLARKYLAELDALNVPGAEVDHG